MCNFGLNICLDCERHNGPFIQRFFFPAPGRNAFFPEQSFAEVLWVVAQVKGPTAGPFFFFFFTQDAFKTLVALWLSTRQASENTGCGSAGDVSGCEGRCWRSGSGRFGYNL